MRQLKSELVKEAADLREVIYQNNKIIMDLNREVNAAKGRLKESNEAVENLAKKVSMASACLKVLSISKSAESHLAMMNMEHGDQPAETVRVDDLYFALREVRQMLGDYTP